jgi:glycosyltransferase involved in cell wall biosynthesis
MKILMFNNEFPPLGGGTGTVNFELFKIFKKNYDLKIDLITSALGPKNEIEQFSENIRIIKFPVRKNNIHHASNLELIIYTFKAIFNGFRYHKKENYDFVFVWSTVPSGLPALLLKIFKKVPFIVRIGGPDIPGFENRYKFIYMIISPLIKLIWKKAILIIVKCKKEKEMIELINSKLQIEKIFNGTDISKFFTIIKNTNNSLKLICSARLIKRKGQYILIDAISCLKKEGIIIISDLVGEGDEKEAYIQYAKVKNVEELIIFSGYVPHEKMPKKYQEADVFVLPSYNEGMSNALLEAMACGLPIVVTNVGGTEELIDESNGFIFNVGDTTELVLILKKIYHNKNILLELSKASRKRAEQYSWQIIADEYLKLFKTLKL